MHSSETRYIQAPQKGTQIFAVIFLMGNLSEHNSYSNGKFNCLKYSHLFETQHELRSLFDTCNVLFLLTFALYVNKFGNILKLL
jgi:hypothetical protein